MPKTLPPATPFVTIQVSHLIEIDSSRVEESEEGATASSVASRRNVRHFQFSGRDTHVIPELKVNVAALEKVTVWA